MGVDVVGSGLGIVFQDKKCGVVPVGAVGDGLHCPSHRQVVISHRGLGRRHPWSGARSVVVGEAELDELRHRIVPLPTILNPFVEVGQKLFHPQLIGKAELEVRILRVKMTDQLRLGRDVFVDQRNWPGIRAGSSAIVLRDRFAVPDVPRAPHCAGSGSGVPWVGDDPLGNKSGLEQNRVEMNSPK